MKFQLLFILTLMFAFSFEAAAVNTVATVDGQMTSLVKKDAQKTNVFQKAGNWFKATKMKVATKIAKKLQAIDWSDSKTILKFWIIGVLAGLALSIVGIIIGSSIVYLLGGLVGLVGAILFWYWVYLVLVK